MSYTPFAGLPYHLGTIAKLAVGAVVLSQIGSLVIAWHDLQVLAFFKQVELGTLDSATLKAQGAAIDDTGLVLGIGVTVLSIAAYIVNCFWVYRSAANSHVMLPEDKRISQGWAVGWFFVPFANLFKPFQAMRQTWNASHDPDGNYDAPAPALLGWWWAAWISFNIVSNGSTRLYMRADSMVEMQQALGFSLAAVPLELASAILFITIIRAITAAQSKAYATAATPDQNAGGQDAPIPEET